MSSVLILPQRNAVHMATDGAAYDAHGVVTATSFLKCIAMPTLSAAIACTGPAENTAMLCKMLSERFNSFDDLICGAESYIPKAFVALSKIFRGGDAFSTIYLIGWHEDEQRPAAYAMDMWTDDSTRMAEVLDNSPNAASAVERRFKLTEITSLAGTPLPGMDLCAAAGFKIRNDGNSYVPEVDLLHLMEVQRHEEIEGHYWIGGKAVLTSIDRHGIKQRVLHHWAEDRPGTPIQPAPIDWKRWQRNHLKPGTASLRLVH